MQRKKKIIILCTAFTLIAAVGGFLLLHEPEKSYTDYLESGELAALQSGALNPDIEREKADLLESENEDDEQDESQENDEKQEKDEVQAPVSMKDGNLAVESLEGRQQAKRSYSDELKRNLKEEAKAFYETIRQDDRGWEVSKEFLKDYENFEKNASDANYESLLNSLQAVEISLYNTETLVKKS